MSKANFGVHQVSLRGTVNGEEVIANATYIDSAEPDLATDNIKLETGSYRYPVETVRGRSSGTLALNLRSFDASLFKLLAPQTANSMTHTENDAVGNIEVLEGLDPIAGIASISINNSDALKYGTYWFKWTSATTVNIYLDNNLSIDFLDESGLVQENLTIANGAPTTWNGIDFTGGTAVAGTIGEVGAFNVVPPSAEYFKQIFGRAGEDTAEIEVRVYGEKIGTKIQKTTYFRCKSNGNVVPKNTMMEFATMEISMDILQNILKNKALETEFINLPA